MWGLLVGVLIAFVILSIVAAVVVAGRVNRQEELKKFNDFLNNKKGG